MKNVLNVQMQRWIVVLAVLCGLFAYPASAQTWYSNIPDFFQHQKWGPGKNAFEDPAWEPTGGWCFQVSTFNQFFYLQKEKGHNGLLPPGVFAAPPNWLVPANQAIQDLVRDMKKGSPVQTACQGDPLLVDRIDCVLDSRGVGPKKKDGLIHVQLKQKYDPAGGGSYHVQYWSSNKHTMSLVKPTIYEGMQAYLKNGDTVNLYLVHDQSDQLWWAKNEAGYFHSVTVAGIDPTAGNGTVWFSDPDSNPDHSGAGGKIGPDGNKNKNAGWGEPDDMVDCGNDGKQHKLIDCIRERRFTAKDSLPVPAGNPPTKDEISQRYYQALLQGDKLSFQGNGADYDRYSNGTCHIDTDPVPHMGTCITEANIIKVPKSTKPKGTAPDGSTSFLISPGASDATPIDEFWIFPASDSITYAIPLPSGPLSQWTVDYYTGTDPWGNDREGQWIHVFATKGNLQGLQTLQLYYGTASGQELAAWDIVVRSGKDDSTLQVEAFGADPPIPDDQPLAQQ